MRQNRIIVVLQVIGLSLALGACGKKEKSAEAECISAANNLARLSKAQNRRPKHATVEHKSNLNECLTSWSKERASCVANAETQDQMIRCRGFRSRQWSENFSDESEAP